MCGRIGDGVGGPDADRGDSGFFFFSSRRRHTRSDRDWSSDVCSSDLLHTMSYEETGKIEFSHNPFSMPQGGLEALESKDPRTIKAYQYDIVCNGVELSSEIGRASCRERV